MGIRVLVDLDDVLVDFCSAAAKLHGWDIEELSKARGSTWCMRTAMGVSAEFFAATILAEGTEFWENLKPFPYWQKLLAEIGLITPDWAIATAPLPGAPEGLPYSCVMGKLMWIRNHLGLKFDRVHVTRYKHHLANSRTVLIDDSEDNVAEFIEAGGEGIIFPAMYNSAAPFIADPIPYVMERVVAFAQQHKDPPKDVSNASSVLP